MKTTLRLVLVLVVLILVAACGNKGDLVHPATAAGQTTPEAPTEKPAADKAAGDKPVGN